jgi:hypothetical protein
MACIQRLSPSSIFRKLTKQQQSRAAQEEEHSETTSHRIQREREVAAVPKEKFLFRILSSIIVQSTNAPRSNSCLVLLCLSCTDHFQLSICLLAHRSQQSRKKAVKLSGQSTAKYNAQFSAWAIHHTELLSSRAPRGTASPNTVRSGLLEVPNGLAPGAHICVTRCLYSDALRCRQPRIGSGRRRALVVAESIPEQTHEGRNCIER